MTDENPNTPPEPEKPAAKGTLYAAYDKTYLRYVGGTHATKKAAGDAAKAAGAKNIEIREV